MLTVFVYTLLLSMVGLQVSADHWGSPRGGRRPDGSAPPEVNEPEAQLAANNNVLYTVVV